MICNYNTLIYDKDGIAWKIRWRGTRPEGSNDDEENKNKEGEKIECNAGSNDTVIVWGLGSKFSIYWEQGYAILEIKKCLESNSAGISGPGFQLF